MTSLPLEPLERWARAHLAPASQAVADQVEPGDVSVGTIADAIGFARGTIHSWRRRSGIPLYSADQVACRLGMHPVDLWPDWYSISDGPSDRFVIIGVMFKPTHPMET
jgi:hypothetical protein